MDRTVADRTDTSAFLHKLNCTSGPGLYLHQVMPFNLYQLKPRQTTLVRFTETSNGPERPLSAAGRLSGGSPVSTVRAKASAFLHLNNLVRKTFYHPYTPKASKLSFFCRAPRRHWLISHQWLPVWLSYTPHCCSTCLRSPRRPFCSSYPPLQSQDDGATRWVCKVLDWKVWLPHFGMFRFSGGE